MQKVLSAKKMLFEKSYKFRDNHWLLLFKNKIGIYLVQLHFVSKKKTSKCKIIK